jgi:hypothetical protein
VITTKLRSTICAMCSSGTGHVSIESRGKSAVWGSHLVGQACATTVHERECRQHPSRQARAAIVRYKFLGFAFPPSLVLYLLTRTLPRASSLVGSRFCFGSQMQNSEFLFASGDQGEFAVLWTSTLLESLISQCTMSATGGGTTKSLRSSLGAKITAAS